MRAHTPTCTVKGYERLIGWKAVALYELLDTHNELVYARKQTEMNGFVELISLVMYNYSIFLISE